MEIQFIFARLLVVDFCQSIRDNLFFFVVNSSVDEFIKNYDAGGQLSENNPFFGVKITTEKK